jgi:hypothetical protein
MFDTDIDIDDLLELVEIDEETNLFMFLTAVINKLRVEKDSKTFTDKLFQPNEKRETLLYKFCSNDEIRSEKSVEKFFSKLKEIKKYVPDHAFKEFLMYRDESDLTFLHCLKKFNSFKIGFDFLHSEFDINIVGEILFTGNKLFFIQESITEFLKVLDLLKNNLDKEFVKEFLMRKGMFNNNFLLEHHLVYSDPKNSSELLVLFHSILTIFGPDSELFNDLFNSKSEGHDQTFFIKLKENYKDDELKLVIDWIENNLGHDFLTN